MQPHSRALAWRSKSALWIALLLAAAAGWIVTAAQASSMSSVHGGMYQMKAGPTSAAVFLPVWVAMMVAMMFPAVAPVTHLVVTIQRKRRGAGSPGVPVVVFLSGYLAVWTLFGACAYLLAMAVPALDMNAPGIRDSSSLIGGLLLILAGVYEWSPLKAACLRHCRSPLGAFMSLWRDGWWGAFRMGFLHGGYCLGCCWGLMLVLFTVGLMNLTVMVLLAAVIFAQKVLPMGESLARLSGVVLVLAGIAVLSPLHP